MGGVPNLAKEIRKDLTSVNPDQLLTELRRRTVAISDLPDGPLRLLEGKRNKYCTAIFADRLYDRLSPSSRRILSRAAVYRGPMTSELFEVATGESRPDLSSTMETLQRSALIRSEYRSPNAGWSIYGTLRGWLIAPERLSVDDRRTAHRALADYLIKVIAQQRQGELEMSHVTCQEEARVHYLLAGANEEAHEVTERLSEVLLRFGEYAEIERLNTELLEIEEHPKPATWIARNYFERDRYDIAEQWYNRVLDLAANYPVEKAQAIQGLAALDLQKDNFLRADEQLREALKIQEDANDHLGQGLTWHQLGSIDLERDDYEAAREKFERALSVLSKLGEPMSFQQAEAEQGVWHQLGSIDLREGRLTEARTRLDKALALAKKIGDRKAEAAAIHQLGRVAAAEGKTKEALENLRDGLQIRRSIGDRLGEALSFRRLGDLAARLGRKDIALQLGMVCYLIDKTLEHGNAGGDLKRVQEQATAVGYTSEGLVKLQAEVEQDYLRTRAKALLTETFALQ
jgi:tetratricopeptide (TPR) repeat protein